MLGAMRLCPWLVAIATCLIVAACGDSSHSSTTSAASAPTATTPSAAANGTGTSSGSHTVAATTTTTASTSAPPEVPRRKTQKHRGSTDAASQGAHVETSVTISGAGDVSPPVVSVPSGVAVEIHVTNHGAAAATVVLAVPTHPSVRVGPGASGRVQTAGLKDGTYRILVNGTPRGQLMIGAQGGP
jgi:hypothetical protein